MDVNKWEPLNEVVSPEGVTERVEMEVTFRITLTQGGRFRVYVEKDGQARAAGVYDTRDDAAESMATGMMLEGGMMTDPEGTLRQIMRRIGKDKPE